MIDAAWKSSVSIILIAIAIWLIRKILSQSLRGEVDLLSTRNFFFVGFLIFHLTSGVLAVWFPLTDEFAHQRRDATGVHLLLVCGPVPDHLHVHVQERAGACGGWRTASRRRRAPAPIVLLMLGIPLVGLGLVFRFLLTGVPIFGAVVGDVRRRADGAGGGRGVVGVVPAACSIRSLRRSRWLVIVTGIAGTLMGSFGRRDVLGVLTGRGVGRATTDGTSTWARGAC
ncbi:MAG: hypothetical protein V9F04_01155 [Dermatophilaceae bacterium]